MGGKGSGPQFNLQRWREIVALRRAGLSGGEIARRLGITKQAVSQQLHSAGIRGLRGDSALAQLLRTRPKEGRSARQGGLDVKTILRWADAHHRRTGRWPSRSTGPVEGASGETWLAIEAALCRGRRGLPGGTTL